MEVEMDYNIDNDDAIEKYNVPDVVLGDSDMLSYDINIDAEKRYGKEKKEKPYKALLYQIGKKRKRRYEISDIQKISNDLIKRKAKTIGDIQSYLNEKKWNATDRQKNLYKFLCTTKVINGNITLSDNLTNKPLYFYYYIRNFTTKTFTNDFLYIACLVSLKANKEVPVIKEIINNCVDVDYLQVVSNSFECTGDIKKGFYQDYTGQFAAIGLSTLDEKQKEDILKMGTKEEFIYKEKGYYSQGDNNACVIVEKNQINNVVNFYNNMKTFSNLSSFNINEKTFELYKKLKFIDCRLKPDSFCPAFMILPNPVRCSMMIRFKYDYNMLFKILDTLYVMEKKVKLVAPPNMIYWNTINEGMDFLAIYSLTSQSLTDEHKNTLHDFYTEYELLKPVINLWKENQIESQRILVEFYNSFTTRIMYDKMVSIHKKVNKFLENREILENDETYQSIIKFFKSISDFSMMINRQLNNEYTVVFKNIQKFLKQFITSKIFNEDSLKDQLSKLGIAIFDLTEIGRENSRFPCIPVLLSPGGFFGDVTISGQKKNKDILKEYIEDYKNKFIKRKQQSKTDLKKFKEFVDYIMNEDNLKTNIKKSIEQINQKMKWGLTNENINDFVEAYLEYIQSDDGAKDYEVIKKIMSEKYLEGENLNNIVLDLDSMVAFFTDYMNQIIDENEMDEIKNESEYLNDQLANQLQKIEDNFKKKAKSLKGISMDKDSKNTATIHTDYDNNLYYVYPTNSTYKQIMQLYKTNRFIQKRLKSYWLDLARLSGNYKINDKDKWYEQIFSKTAGDVYNKYPLEDLVIAKVIYDNDLPTIEQMLMSEVYSSAYNKETPVNKITLKDVEKDIGGKGINVEYIDDNVTNLRKKIRLKPPVSRVLAKRRKVNL